MNADLEHLASVIRVYPNGGKYGDPYTFCAAVRHLDRESVEIVGALRSPTPSEWRAIRAALVEAGIVKAMFTRIKDGVKSRHQVLLERNNDLGRAGREGDRQGVRRSKRE
jgi:hypothetical protein